MAEIVGIDENAAVATCAISAESGNGRKGQFVMGQAASNLFRDCKGALHTDDNRI
jgi:hypothetical protein